MARGAVDRVRRGVLVGVVLMKRVIAALAVAGLGLASCSIFDAHPTLQLGVTTHSAPGGMPQKDAEALANYYAKWLSEEELDSDEAMDVDEQSVPADERISAVRNGDVGLVFGCTGEFIDLLDPHKGQQLRDLFAEQSNPDMAEWRDISHSTMLAALPADVAASIPGEAQGCTDDSLPQNVVAVYQKDLLTREQRTAVNNATAGMSFD